MNESLIIHEMNIPEEYNSVKTYHDRRFGNVTLLNSKRNKSIYYLQKTVLYPTEEEAKRAIDTLKIRSNAGPYYAKYVIFESQSLNKLCLEAVQIRLIIEYSKNTLKSEIRRHKQSETAFGVEEMFQIFTSALCFCEYLRFHNEREHLLGPQSILLHPNGNVTLIESKFLKPETDIYKKLFAMCTNTLKRNQFSLLAPEEFKALIDRVSEPNIDHEKAQIFCLGITLFCAVGLCEPQKFFDLDELKFLPDVIEKLVFESNLPIELLEIMLKCVKQDPDKRSNTKQLLKDLDLLKVRLQIDSNLEEAVFRKKSQRYF